MVGQGSCLHAAQTCIDTSSCEAYGKLPGSLPATLMLISAGGVTGSGRIMVRPSDGDTLGM
jgi:hypothetical protein